VTGSATKNGEVTRREMRNTIGGLESEGHVASRGQDWKRPTGLCGKKKKKEGLAASWEKAAPLQKSSWRAARATSLGDSDFSIKEGRGPQLGGKCEPSDNAEQS